MPQHTNTAPFVTKAGESTVTRDQILQAIQKFDEEKRGKVSDTQAGWFIEENEQRYPPKWLLKLATKLLMDEFRGREARKTLSALGFDLKEVDDLPEENGEEGAEIQEQAIEMTFRIERDLQAALRLHIEQLLNLDDNVPFSPR